jgi:predicted naringenin-chalcone synthase
MFLTGIGTSVPKNRYLKSECWDAFQVSDWFQHLSPRSHAIAKTVLLRDNGTETRFLAIDSLDEVFQIDPDTLNARFLANAPALAGNAGLAALNQAHLEPNQIDAVVVSTCTGMLCPGLSGYVVEQLGLRPDVQAFDLVGQGCAAALPNMRLTKALLDSGHCTHVLSICVEVCSAAMYLDDDPGVMISACLFGDGAGAAVFSSETRKGTRRVEWKDSESLINPAKRHALQFEQRNGMLRNILSKDVPYLAAEHAQQVFHTVLHRAGMKRSVIKEWILHAGGRDVLLALAKKFDAGADDFRYSATMLREYGNLSSAFVYFVLQAALMDNAQGGAWWLSSFGAGFSCHGALLSVE